MSLWFPAGFKRRAVGCGRFAGAATEDHAEITLSGKTAAAGDIADFHAGIA